MKKPRRKIDAALKAKIALVFETALANAVRVTVRLRGDGGLHRPEGVVYDIT